jgi:hypothetical protein
VPTHVQPPKGSERPAALRPRNGDSASWQRQRSAPQVACQSPEPPCGTCYFAPNICSSPPVKRNQSSSAGSKFCAPIANPAHNEINRHPIGPNFIFKLTPATPSQPPAQIAGGDRVGLIIASIRGQLSPEQVEPAAQNVRAELDKTFGPHSADQVKGTRLRSRLPQYPALTPTKLQSDLWKPTPTHGANDWGCCFRRGRRAVL